MDRRTTLSAISALLLLLAGAISAHADTWTYPSKREETQFKFGSIRIVKIYDGTRSRGDSGYVVDIYLKDDLKARYRGISFEHFAASKDNELFVGVSNSGAPGSAIIMFDSEGSLLGYVSHDYNRLHYCMRSVSIVRAWYDSTNPEIRFEEQQWGKLRDITIRSCDGKRISIRNLLGGRRSPSASRDVAPQN